MTERSSDFRENRFLWLIVRHFLGAKELRELCSEIVSSSSDGDLVLADLCEELSIPSDDRLSTWTVRMRSGEGFLRNYLRSLVQTIVWQGDGEASSHSNDADPTQIAIAKALEATLQLSAADFETFQLSEKEIVNFPPSLEGFLLALRTLRDAIRSSSTDVILPGFTIDGTSPLSAILTKHLGDLCVDANAWHLASQLYDSAEDLLATCTRREWKSLTSAVSLMIAQSKAATQLMIEGSGTVIRPLESLLDRAGSDDIVTIKNVIPDLFRARVTVDPMQYGTDRAVSLVFAPQLIDNRSLTHAFQAWADQRFLDSNRWFWAVLRRQIAFGSSEERNSTKGYFGLSLLDMAKQQLGKQSSDQTFALALRMLIDSQNYPLVEKYSWTKELIAAYVREDEIQFAIKVAETEFDQSQMQPRRIVVAGLFKGWLCHIPAERSAEADEMMAYLAKLAQADHRSFWKSQNSGSYSLQVIKTIAEIRPEFRQNSVSAVTDAILRCLERSDPLEVGDAIRVADLYTRNLDFEQLKRVTTGVLHVTEAIANGEGQWPIVRPALEFLSQIQVAQLFGADASMGKRVATELLRLSIGSTSEYPTTMYLLQNLDPELIRGNLSEEKLHHVIETLQEQAKQVNSTVSSSAIQALLIAPRISGAAALRVALESLASAMKISNSRRTSIAFNDAVYPIISLCKNATDIRNELGLKAEEMRELVQPIADDLCTMWEMSAANPSIFAPFAIPAQSKPNPTLVHNWSFASATFAKAFGFETELEKATALARSQDDLRTAVDVGRAVFNTGAAGMDEELIDGGTEGREAFYAILGTRLVVARSLEGRARPEGVLRLLRSALAFGPDGQDVAVLLEALGLDLTPEDRHLADRYRERLLVSQSLRNSLIPLLDRLLSNKDAK